jgi:uncharacterized FlaG/YvyC family protein
VIGGLVYSTGKAKRAAEEAVEAEIAAAEKAARAEQERADKTTAALESVADTEKKVADARKRAEEEATRDAVSNIDWLYDHLNTAIRRQYEAQQNAAEDSLKTQEDAARKGHDAALKRIEDEKDAFVRAKQAEIAAVDEEMEALDRANAAADTAARIADLQAELLRTSDPEEARRITEQIEDARNDAARRKQREALEDRKEAIQEEIDVKERAAEEEEAKADQALADQEARLEEIRDIVQTHYERMLDDQRVQAEAEQMILNDNQAAMIDVLKSWAPEYFTLGKSFGERLIAGYVGKQPDFQKALNYSMNYVQNAASIIEAAADKAEAEARRVEAAAARALAAAQQLGTAGGSTTAPAGQTDFEVHPSWYYTPPNTMPGDISAPVGQEGITIYGNVEVKANRIDDPERLAADLKTTVRNERWAGVADVPA